MMGFRNIAVALTGDASSLGRALRQGAAQVDQFGNHVETSNRRQQASWLKGAAAVGVAVVSLHAAQAGFAATVGAAAGFEQRMRNVNSITHASEGALAALGSRTLALSRELPQSANNLAEGLYDIASSGFQGADGLTVLNASAEAASAGLTTTANSAKAITAVLNAYGLGADKATDVSDSLFQTVNLGVVSFEELTGVIGDVVGTAAAASVDINQVGAAVATMTLSGISAAESGTSLNRVLQSLIQPSDALASQLEALGYESGEQALKTDGLRGVMEKLRTATGGNVTALLALFPEIRAARGALALMSDEGRNYTKVAKEIEDADRRQGATRKALNEQLKAVTAQWQLFENRAAAAGIQAGTRLLPVVLDLLTGMQDLAHDALPTLQAGFAHLQPLMAAVAAIVGDVLGFLGSLEPAATSAAGALLTVVGGGVLASLTELAQGLAALTGFLADNRDALVVVASVLGGAYLASLLASAAATVAFNITVARAVIATGTFNGSLLSLRVGAGLAMASLRGLAAALVSVQTVATIGIAAGILSWVRYADVQGDVATAVDGTAKAIRAGTVGALKEQRDALIATRTELEKTRSSYADASFISRFFKTFTGGAAAAVSATHGLDDVERAIGRVDITSQRAQENLHRVLQERMTPEALDKLMHDAPAFDAAMQGIADQAAKLGIDVSGSYTQFGKLGDALRKETGLTAAVLKKNFDTSETGLADLSKQLQETADAVTKSFTSATDIIATFKPDEAAGRVVKASSAHEKALRSLSQLEERQAGKKKTTIADEQALANARQKVADATGRVTDAQSVAARGSLAGQYTSNIALAERFADSLQTATKRGLDPRLIARLLEQGPEAAAPVLQALVADHSGRLIKMANESEEKLREINQRVVEFSRLTTLAVSASTDTLTRDLGRAMSIASAELASGGKKTASELAKSLHIPRSEVVRIANEFGITLQKELNKHHPTITPVLAPGAATAALAGAQNEDRKYSRGGQRRFATGGPVTGPGSGTSDSILIAASNNEHMLTAAEVAAAGGHSAIVAWRRMVLAQRTPFVRVPGYASGGPILPRQAAASVTVVRVPVSEQRTHSAPTYIDKLVAHDYDDFRAQLDRDAARRSTAGNRGL